MISTISPQIEHRSIYLNSICEGTEQRVSRTRALCASGTIPRKPWNSHFEFARKRKGREKGENKTKQSKERERERERERVPESCAKFISTSLLYRRIPSICRFQDGFVAFGKVELAALLFVHPHPSVLSAGTKLGIGSNPAPRPRQPLIIKNFTSRAAGFVICLLKPEVRAN